MKLVEKLAKEWVEKNFGPLCRTERTEGYTVAFIYEAGFRKALEALVSEYGESGWVDVRNEEVLAIADQEVPDAART